MNNSVFAPLPRLKSFETGIDNSDNDTWMQHVACRRAAEWQQYNLSHGEVHTLFLLLLRALIQKENKYEKDK